VVTLVGIEEHPAAAQFDRKRMLDRDERVGKAVPEMHLNVDLRRREPPRTRVRQVVVDHPADAIGGRVEKARAGG
jgi:hypothetical protein